MPFLHILSPGFHLLWAVGFVWVLWFVPYGEQILPRPEWFGRCDGCDQTSDAISIASQMGRLDVVSIALTILGVVIGAAALGSYVLIRNAAMTAAREETHVWMTQNIGKISPDLHEALISDTEFVQNLANQIQTALSGDDIFVLTLVNGLRNSISKPDADGIAESMEE